MVSSSAEPHEDIIPGMTGEDSGHVSSGTAASSTSQKGKKSEGATQKRMPNARSEKQQESTAAEAATPGGPAREDRVERAEVLLEHTGQRLGEFARIASRRLRRWTALAQEEIEDLWAEAQSTRSRWWARSDDQQPKR